MLIGVQARHRVLLGDVCDDFLLKGVPVLALRGGVLRLILLRLSVEQLRRLLFLAFCCVEHHLKVVVALLKCGGVALPLLAPLHIEQDVHRFVAVVVGHVHHLKAVAGDKRQHLVRKYLNSRAPSLKMQE